MTDPITVYRRTTGLNNAVDQARLVYDPETGSVELATAKNIVIDDTGRICMRVGFGSALLTGSWSSIWYGADTLIGVRGSELVKVDADFGGYTTLTTATPGSRLSCVESSDGRRIRIFWTTGFEQGVIVDGANQAWSKGTYTGPDTSEHLSGPPSGHLLELRRLRIFVAQDKTLFWSYLPGNDAYFSMFAQRKDRRQFASRITMLRAVKGGMWLGTEKEIWWLGGEIAPLDTQYQIQDRKATYGAIEGTCPNKLIDLSRINPGFAGLGVIFTTTKGICVGGPDGMFVNLTQDRLIMPAAKRGCAVLQDDRYICLLEP